MIYSKLNIKSHLKVIWNGIILYIWILPTKWKQKLKQDVAGVSSDLYKEYHPWMGNPCLWWCHFIWVLILETFQAGLSWITILNKGEFQKAFDNFDYKKIAFIRKTDQALLLDAGIIHNKLVRSAVTNAIAFMEIQKEFGSFQITSGHLQCGTL
jgi:3-methyladenine DNA glycosylase Tag